MAKQNTQVDDLPTLDDFTESSLLDVVEVEEEVSKTTEEEEEEDEEEIENPLEDKIPAEKPKKKAKEKPAEGLEEEEKKKDDDEEEDEEKEKEDDQEGSFWTDVERITGVEVEVDYGDADPESPEGAAIREAALVTKTEAGIWKYIEDNFPKSFKALTVEANGGDLSELITPDYVDYAKITVEEDNVAQQKKILMNYYMEVKNLSEAKATRMVEGDEDDSGLFTAAKEALEERKEAQATRESEVATKNKKEAEERERQDQQMLGYIKAVTDKGEIGNFQIAGADKEEFFNFFAGQVNRGPEGGYIFSSPLTNENFQKLMEQAYFSFKGGEIDKLVQRREKTTETRKLKRRASNEKKKGSSSAEEKKQKNALPTMDDYKD
jgi:hypothetical protein